MPDTTNLDADILPPKEDSKTSTLVLYALIFGVIYALYNGHVKCPCGGSKKPNRNYRPLNDSELNQSDPESDEDDPSARKKMMEMSSFKRDAPAATE